MKFPIEMYKIREEDVKIKVPCEHCLEKGIVDRRCNKCGGNGVHNKTIKVWKVMPRTVTVDRIDRSPVDSHTSHIGGLRYWISYSEFYSEESKLLHFNKDDAWNECVRRNADIADVLKIYSQNKKFEEYDEQMERVKLLCKRSELFCKCTDCLLNNGYPCGCGIGDCPVYKELKNLL